MTEGNLEYDLYTCINAVAISYIERDIPDVNANLNRIEELLRKGKNYFTKFQCLNTIDDVKKLYDLDELELEIWKKLKGGRFDEQYSLY
jgi:hypothetical protein